MEKRQIDISTGIIFRTILIILGLLFIYVIRDVIALFFIAVVLTAAIEPAVNWFQKKKIPRAFGVLIIYFAIFLIIGSLISFLVPSIVHQFQGFAQDFPNYLERISKSFNIFENYTSSKGIEFNKDEFFQNIGGGLTNSSGQIFSTTLGVFSGFLSIIVVFSMTFYMSVIEDGMKKFLISIVPGKHQDYAVSLAVRIKEKIGRWMIGQLFLMLVIFAMYYIALSVLGVPYALILAMFGGILEIIPYLGPILAAIPAVIVGLLVSPITGLLVLALYIIIQQFENHVIVPQIMKKAIGLNPLAVVLAIIVGAKLAGPFGAILAVPVATAISVFLGDFMKKPEEEDKNAEDSQVMQ